MAFRKDFKLTPELRKRYHCFILFEPSSARLNNTDILYTGEKVKEIYNELVESIVDSEDIKDQIVYNRIKKIGQMISLSKSTDNIIMTKFMDRVWRRYIYVSNIGEYFLDIENYEQRFPGVFKNMPVEDYLSQRIDDLDEDEETELPGVKKEVSPDIDTEELNETTEKEAIQ